MVLSNQQKSSRLWKLQLMYLQAICNCWIKLITHHFKLSEVEKAYDVFKHAGENHALKVIIENDISEWSGD